MDPIGLPRSLACVFLITGSLAGCLGLSGCAPASPGQSSQEQAPAPAAVSAKPEPVLEGKDAEVEPLCEPGRARCSESGGRGMTTCSDDGSEWVEADCGSGEACQDPGTGARCIPVICIKGETRCNKSSAGARMACSLDGTAWAAASPCAEGQVCKEFGADARCEAIICTPSSTRCGSTSPGARETCSADGTSWERADPCAAREVCLSEKEGASCAQVVCAAGKTRCSSSSSTGRQTCSDTGTEWIDSSPCAQNEVCVESDEGPTCQKVVCTAQASRCSKESATAREACTSNGTKWAPHAPCSTGEACIQSGDRALCAAVVCEPGSSRCGSDSAASREICSTTGTRWEPANCSATERCKTDGATAGCAVILCTSGSVRCSSDNTSVVTCSADGTSEAHAACGSSETCIAGTCRARQTPLGEVAFVESGSIDLLPGKYALAVVDLETSTSTPVPFPARLTDAATGAAVSPATSPLAALLPNRRPLPIRAPFRCGTLDHVEFSDLPHATLVDTPARTPVVYRVGDKRTFRYPSGYTTTERVAELRMIGTYANYWEDQTVLPHEGVISSTALMDIARRFDSGITPRNARLLGELTDVDQNGKVDVLFTDLLPSSSSAAFVHPTATLFDYGLYDYGEVVYSMAPNETTDAAAVAGILAHELGHLHSIGKRLQPYLATGYGSVPRWLFTGNRYIEEGIAELALGWSGQSSSNLEAATLYDPAGLSFHALEASTYFSDREAHLRGYGLSSLVMHYLLGQAGGVEVTGPGKLADKGGLAFMQAVSTREQGTARLAPLDGREFESWALDFTAALLVTTDDELLSESAKANSRFQFPTTQADLYFGGFNGPTLRKEHSSYWSYSNGAILQRIDWSQRPTTIPSGGLSVLDVSLSSPARLIIDRATSRAVIIRYQ